MGKRAKKIKKAAMISSIVTTHATKQQPPPSSSTEKTETMTEPSTSSIDKNEDYPELVIADKRLWKRIVADNLEFFAEVKLPEATLSVNWVGPKIPWDVWYQVIAFFELSYHETKSETQARFYFNNETKEWKVWAFPQFAGTGMTTREVPDDPRRKEQDAAIGKGFKVMGTIHHHCTMKAFQSGVDKDDEYTQGGLHITVGHLGSDLYDLHGRVVIRGQQHPVVWSQWFESDEQIEEQLKSIRDKVNAISEYKDLFPIPSTWDLNEDSLRNKYVEHFLKIPPVGDIEIPDQWMKNLVKPTYSGGHSHMGCGNGNYQHNKRKFPLLKYEEACAKALDELSVKHKIPRSRVSVLLDGLSEQRVGRPPFENRRPKGHDEKAFIGEADREIIKAKLTVELAMKNLDQYWDEQEEEANAALADFQAQQHHGFE